MSEILSDEVFFHQIDTVMLAKLPVNRETAAKRILASHRAQAAEIERLKDELASVRAAAERYALSHANAKAIEWEE